MVAALRKIPLLFFAAVAHVPSISTLAPMQTQVACPLCAAGSTDQRNTGVKSLCWGFKLQGLAGPFVELTRHFVQMGL